jgi:rod shape determining protein RodA
MNKFFTTKVLVGCLLILNLLSVLALYSSMHQGGEFVGEGILKKQVIWIVIFWLVVLIFSFINYRIYYDASFAIYVVNIILLIAVVFWGQEAMGARRWFSVFGIHFQPSELSKIAVILLLARLFCLPAVPSRQTFLTKTFIPLVAVSISALLIFKQPDLGTALILVMLFFIIGLASKVRKKYFITLIIVGLVLAPLGWSLLKDYQKDRLTVFLNPNSDPLGAGYTIIQSKIAIGSGGFSGKGFLSGTQNQFNFLPERHTDFIFTVLAEEFGFIGCLGLLALYFLILMTILRQAQAVKDEFARLLCFGIYGIIFLHLFINIGMTMGFLPVVGLPLFFLSYGGTHLFISAILIGIFINVSRKIS